MTQVERERELAGERESDSACTLTPAKPAMTPVGCGCRVYPADAHLPYAAADNGGSGACPRGFARGIVTRKGRHRLGLRFGVVRCRSGSGIEPGPGGARPVTDGLQYYRQFVPNGAHEGFHGFVPTTV